MNTRSQFITLSTQALLILCLALPQAAQAIPHFTDNGDGTVTDRVTGLMWDQCSQGQSGAACATGTAGALTWSAALTAAVTANSGAGYKGYSDWRLPNKNELESIVDISVATNPAIDFTDFRNPRDSDYWSSTTYTPGPGLRASSVSTSALPMPAIRPVASRSGSCVADSDLTLLWGCPFLTRSEWRLRRFAGKPRSAIELHGLWRI